MRAKQDTLGLLPGLLGALCLPSPGSTVDCYCEQGLGLPGEFFHRSLGLLWQN